APDASVTVPNRLPFTAWPTSRPRLSEQAKKDTATRVFQRDMLFSFPLPVQPQRPLQFAWSVGHHLSVGNHRAAGIGYGALDAKTEHTDSDRKAARREHKHLCVRSPSGHKGILSNTLVIHAEMLLMADGQDTSSVSCL